MTLPREPGLPGSPATLLRAAARRAARVAVGAGIIALAACGGDAPIQIGVVLSSNGEAAAQLAADDINRRGGVNGRRLDLAVIRENNPDAGPALAAAESLAAIGVVAVVGHSNSATSLAASQIYNAQHVVQVAPTSSAPLLSDAGPFTFRLVASDVHQARFIATHIATLEPVPRVAALYVNDDYGRALHEQLMRELGERGVSVVHHAAFLSDLQYTAAADLARALSDARVELVVWLGRANELRAVMPVLRERLPDVRVLGSDAVQNSASLRNADGVLTGVSFVRIVAGRQREELAALREAVAARGMMLSDEMLLSYDAVGVIAHAIAQAGSAPEAIRDYLEGVGTAHPPFAGLSGRIAFDRNGDVVPRYSIDTIAPPTAGTGR